MNDSQDVMSQLHARVFDKLPGNEMTHCQLWL